MSRRRSKRRRARRRRRIGLIFLMLILAAATALMLQVYSLECVYVSGAVHISAAEITDLVLENQLFENTVTAFLLNHHRKVTDTAFVESVATSWIDRNTLGVRVTEYDLVGRIRQGRLWWYIDANGIVRGSDEDPLTDDGIPVIEGLDIQLSPILSEKLPIINTKVFGMMAILHRLMENSDQLRPEKVLFEGDSTMSVFQGPVEVKVGSGEKLELRLRELISILPGIPEGVSGVLHLENYDGSLPGIVFEKSE